MAASQHNAAPEVKPAVKACRDLATPPGNSASLLQSIVSEGGGKETNESWLYLFWPIGSATGLVLRNHCRWHFLLLMKFVSWGVVCVWPPKANCQSNAIETNLTI